MHEIKLRLSGQNLLIETSFGIESSLYNGKIFTACYFALPWIRNHLRCAPFVVKWTSPLIPIILRIFGLRL